MLKATCHCGSVEIQVAHSPTEVTECSCSICHRYGVRWAYYHPDQVVFTIAGKTDTYARGERTIAFHRCAACGCVTHWAPLTREPNRMGVNARLFPLASLAGVRVRHLDGAGTEEYID